MKIIDLTNLKRVGTVGLVVAAGVTFASCAGIEERSRAITPNEYSASVGSEQIKADEDECRLFGTTERLRLLNELMAGDPTVADNQARETSAEDTARTMARLKGATTAEGDLIAGAAEILFSSRDSDTYDESKLATYLGIDGGLGDGFNASQRLRYTCLRAKGYRVDDHDDDGTGTAHLIWAPPSGVTRVVLREEDSTERVFYEYVVEAKK